MLRSVVRGCGGLGGVFITHRVIVGFSGADPEFNENKRGCWGGGGG